MFQLIIYLSLILISVFLPGLGALGLLFGYVMADRTFAIINVVQYVRIPLFISEPVLGILFCHAVYQSWKHHDFYRWQLSWKSPWFWFYAIGAFNILLGIYLNSPIDAFRDAGMIFYAVITQITVSLVRSPRPIKVLFFTVTAGLIVRGFFHYVVFPFNYYVALPFDYSSTTRHMYGACVLLAAFCVFPFWGKSKVWVYLAAGLMVASLITYCVRTTWVALVLACFVMFVLMVLLKMDLKPFASLVATLVVSTALTIVILKVASPRQYVDVDDEFFSMFKGRNTPNLMTRVGMWEDAIQEIIPATGPFFDKFDKAVLNPFLFESPERPNTLFIEKKKARLDPTISHDVSATDILNKFESSTPNPIKKDKPTTVQPIKIVKVLEGQVPKAPVKTIEAPKPPDVKPEAKPDVKPAEPKVETKPVEPVKMAEITKAPVVKPIETKPLESVKKVEVPPAPVEKVPESKPVEPPPVKPNEAIKPVAPVQPVPKTQPPTPPKKIIKAPPVTAVTPPPVPETPVEPVKKIEFITRFSDSHLRRALFGVPFGERFIPERVLAVHQTNRYDPHNFLIAMFYRMGILGLLVFIALIVREIWKSFLFAKRTGSSELKHLTLAVLVCLFYHIGHSMSDVSLENPFKGGLFWLLLGLLISLRTMSPSDNA